MGKYEDLERLQKLKESGVLTEEEFNAEKAKILNGNNDNISNTTNNSVSNSSDNTNGEILEIKGDFPFAKSKIQLKLLDNEKVIIQEEITTLTGVGSTAVNGLITLTTRRILFNKKTTAKSYFTTGLLGVALAAGNKNEEINLKQIQSIEAKTIRTNKGGMEIITNDGYSHKYIFSNKQISIRDMIIELIQNTINQK